MKISKSLLQTTNTFLACALLVLSIPSKADHITLVADRWYPYNGIPESPKPGYIIEIANRVFSQAGHTVDYQIMSWERALRLTREGKKNCVIGAYKSEAPDFIFPSTHQGVDQTIFIKRKADPWLYNGIESLHTIRFGVIGGYEYSDEITAYINQYQNNPQRISIARGKFPLEENMRALKNGEIGALLGSRTVINATIEKQQWLNQFVFAGEADVTSKIYLACSPANPKSHDYVAILDEGLKQLRKQGDLDKILAKYGLTDWIETDAVDN
ncbi:ABC transporter substrate-binding protein [Oceanicoccus sp. KOV_DT_Chl]|uniref:substrate-binding periplasmic protein n=1 Tax=Oceanicoccus sp. KOV_DT_Chl TaxID=1904639 RepID=UPI000C7DFB56|nr:transporter substrate-binding domain-containing protein [Oceanicoccus sp. KOV_DT_Chl]